MVPELRHQHHRGAVEPADQLRLRARPVASPPRATVPPPLGNGLDGFGQPRRDPGEGEAGVSQPLRTGQACDAQGPLVGVSVHGRLGPLCAFLGKPVPDVPFPRVNDSEALQELLTIVIKRGLYNAFKRAVTFTLPLAVLVLGIWLLYRVYNIETTAKHQAEHKLSVGIEKGCSTKVAALISGSHE